MCICPMLARVLNSRRGRYRAAALAAVHEQPFALSHCAVGDLLCVLGTHLSSARVQVAGTFWGRSRH